MYRFGRLRLVAAVFYLLSWLRLTLLVIISLFLCRRLVLFVKVIRLVRGLRCIRIVRCPSDVFWFRWLIRLCLVALCLRLTAFGLCRIVSLVRCRVIICLCWFRIVRCRLTSWAAGLLRVCRRVMLFVFGWVAGRVRLNSVFWLGLIRALITLWVIWILRLVCRWLQLSGLVVILI